MDWGSPSPSAVGANTEGSDGEIKSETEDDEAMSELDWPHKLEADTTSAAPSGGKLLEKIMCEHF